METTKKITFTQGERVAIANMIDAGGKFGGLRVARGAGELVELLALEPDARDNIPEGDVEVDVSLEQAQRFIPVADAACRARGLEMAQLAVGFIAKLMSPAPEEPRAADDDRDEDLDRDMPEEPTEPAETVEDAHRRIRAALTEDKAA